MKSRRSTRACSSALLAADAAMAAGACRRGGGRVLDGRLPSLAGADPAAPELPRRPAGHGLSFASAVSRWSARSAGAGSVSSTWRATRSWAATWP